MNIGERTGERDGEDPPLWCGGDGMWRDIWPAKTPPVACKVVVYRKGHSRGYVGIAYWDFYAQYTYKGDLNHMWGRGGPNMLAKCAEALALRKAFPNELSGLYTTEEMAQAENPSPPPKPKAKARPRAKKKKVEQEVIDVMSPEEAAEWQAKAETLVISLKDAPDSDSLRELARQCNEFPKGSPERKLVMEVYYQQKAELETEEMEGAL